MFKDSVVKNSDILTEIFSHLDLRKQFEIRYVNHMFMSVYNHLKRVRMNIDYDKHVFYNHNLTESLEFFKIKKIEKIDDGIYGYLCVFEIEEEVLIVHDEMDVYDDDGNLCGVMYNSICEIRKKTVQQKVFFDVYGTPCCDTPGKKWWSSKVRKYDVNQVEFYKKNWWKLVPMRRFPLEYSH
jgi:hypothetical protein